MKFSKFTATALTITLLGGVALTFFYGAGWGLMTLVMLVVVMYDGYYNND